MVEQSLIEDLRNAFTKDVSVKGLDSVHPKDYERVKTDDDWLKRFLLHNDGNLDLALKMLWGSVTWRKDFKVNDINESTVKMDIIIQGGFFPHGKDIDGYSILIFKSKRHVKGNVDPDELRRCVVYWFERLERQDKGERISILFDMEGCGLSNMDMDFTKYLIGLFKEYYPYFLNYIIIYEMPWVLSAAFKIIKSWLPEKAIERIKFVSKKDITNYVPPDQALKCWGGENDYVFSFVPEKTSDVGLKASVEPTSLPSKKVHFVDGSPMSEVPPTNSSEKEDVGPLKVTPSSIITFVREGSELVSTLELQNSHSSTHLSFKLKTTSPEKFRVKPSSGCLIPGASATVTVTLLPGFQLGGLSKDKFLVMSTALEEKEISNMSNLDLSDLWKNTTGKKVYQHRLRCVQSGEVTKNGIAVSVSSPSMVETDQTLTKLAATVSQLSSCQSELHTSIRKTQYYQMATIVLVLVLGLALGYVLRTELSEISNQSYCRDPRGP